MTEYFDMIFMPISIWYTNFGQNEGEIWKIIEIGIDMYIIKKKSCGIFIEFSIVHKIGYNNAI